MASPLAARVRHALLRSATVLGFVLLAGVTYQGVATAVERRQYPYPGRLIDVGGHQLHIYCVGEGSPAVVLEAPAAGVSTGWQWVLDGVRGTTRVCSYDRAGLAWSEAGDQPFDPTKVSTELHTLFQRAGERGPIIMAGQGLGAAFARLYAARYRDDVAALVLIDESPASASREERSTTRLVNASPWLARSGLLRITKLMSRRAGGLPGESGGATRAFLNRPDHLTRAGMELSRLEATTKLAAAARLDPAVPVIQLSTGSRDPLALIASSDQAAKVVETLKAVVLRIRQQSRPASGRLKAAPTYALGRAS